MKKLILIFGTFAIIFVVASASLNNHYASTKEVGDTSTQIQTDTQPYTIKSENDRIVVYRGDTLLYRTTTSVNTLPKKDRKTLLEGITVTSQQELKRLLDDYCS